MAYYEAVLLNPDARRVDIRQSCGHKHRTPEAAERCGSSLWGANRCQRVAKVSDDTHTLVGDTTLPINDR